MSAPELHLDANEGPAPPTDLMAELTRAPADLLRRYPRTGALERLLADRLGIAADRVLATNGSNDALDRIMRTSLAGGGRLVLPVPAFSMFDRFTRLAGGRIVEVPWFEGPFPRQAVLRRCRRRTALLVLTSPNNPTGAVIETPLLTELARSLPGVLILLDLAYVEFADEDPSAEVLQLPNVVIVRTLSKAWGLAGLRVGYAAGEAALISRLRLAGQNFPVAGPSAVLAAARIASGNGALARSVAEIRRERELLSEDLRAIGASPLPSQANFILARFPDAEGAHRRLAAGGIAVRIFPDVPRLAGWLRITCPGSADDFARLRAALRTLPAETDRSPVDSPSTSSAQGVER